MANPEHLKILKKGVKAWNKWREENPEIWPDLSDAIFSEVNLQGVNFRDTRLVKTNLRRAMLNKANFTFARLDKADLSETELVEANFLGADLFNTEFSRAYMWKANLKNVEAICAIFHESYLVEANLQNANLFGGILTGAYLLRANLAGADLNQAKLQWANFSGANLDSANLAECYIHGISAWNVSLENTVQSNLVISDGPGLPLDVIDSIKSQYPDVKIKPVLTVDNLEVAQFIYLLLNNQRIRQVLDTITSKVVLILGRFTPERKQVLDALRDELRNQNYSPVVFDFPAPKNQDLTETVSTLAHLSRFIIVDLSDPSSVPHEIATIAPQCIRPIKPIIVHEQEVERYEYVMFQDLRRRYSWVLDTFHYQDIPHLVAPIRVHIIIPSEEKVKELENQK